MELLVLGDSLPFRRPQHGVARNATWPYLLRESLEWQATMRAYGGSTVAQVRAEAKKLASYWSTEDSSGKFFDLVCV